MITIQAEPLRQLVATIFRKAGSDESEARLIGQRLVEANLKGHDSHGVVRVQTYTDLIKNNGVSFNQHASVVWENDVIAVVDGNFGFGQVVGGEAIEIGIAKAKRSKLAMVALRNASHIGRIGDWSEMCAAAGFASVHFVNVTGHVGLVAAFGGAERRLSTNPFSAALPMPGADPIVLDMATSKLAEGKVRVALNKGVELPEGAIVDNAGKASRDPKDFYGPPEGALLPFGEHKGYGLAVFCELFAGLVPGGGCNQPENPLTGRIVNSMLSFIFDAGVGMPGGYADEARRLVDHLKSSTPTTAGGEVLVPGEPERRTKADRLANGVPLDDKSWSDILACGRHFGLGDAEMRAIHQLNSA